MEKATLYIATHNITGLKYFGVTRKYFEEDKLQKYYHGSGIDWKRHLKKHGDDVTMKLFGIFSLNKNDPDYIVPIALKFSEENKISESLEWANKVPEDGINGQGMYGKKHSEETKEKIGNSGRGKKVSEQGRKNISESQKGKRLSEDHKRKLSDKLSGENHPFYGKTHSEETKIKISKSKTGVKLKLVKCPHCNKEGGGGAMRQWHFDNCKHKH